MSRNQPVITMRLNKRITMEHVKSVDLKVGDIFTISVSKVKMKWRVIDLATVKKGGDSDKNYEKKISRTYIRPMALGITKGCLIIGGNFDVVIHERGNAMSEIRYGVHRGKSLENVSHGWLRWARREAASIFDREQLEWIDANVEKYSSES